jgi:hypothetical protein
MRVILNSRQGLVKSEIVSKKNDIFQRCSITIAEFDLGDEIIGTVEIISHSPECLIDLGKDIIVAALDLKQQLAQEPPDEPFAIAQTA